jgi:hypothetical protein
MEIIKGTNIAARFLLELCALGALGSWGVLTGRPRLAKVGLGIGAPLVAAVAWALMVAPEATISVPAIARLAVELAVFGSAVAALLAIDRARLASLLAVAYIVNRTLMVVWGQ